VIGEDFAGKSNFASPEQIGLYGGAVTAKSDIYSLGLTLAAALLGAPIKMSGTPADLVLMRQKVPDLSGIDPEIRPLLERMLQPDPANRPASMAEVAAWPDPVPSTANGWRLTACYATARPGDAESRATPVAWLRLVCSSGISRRHCSCRLRRLAFSQRTAC